MLYELHLELRPTLQNSAESKYSSSSANTTSNKNKRKPREMLELRSPRLLIGAVALPEQMPECASTKAWIRSRPQIEHDIVITAASITYKPGTRLRIEYEWSSRTDLLATTLLDNLPHRTQLKTSWQRPKLVRFVFELSVVRLLTEVIQFGVLSCFQEFEGCPVVWNDQQFMQGLPWNCHHLTSYLTYAHNIFPGLVQQISAQVEDVLDVKYQYQPAEKKHRLKPRFKANPASPW